MIKASILSISVSSRVTVAGLLVLGLSACSGVTGPVEPAGSIVLADLGADGNAKAIAQYNEFKGKLDADFVKPEPGTQSLFFSGFRPFQGGTQNVSGQTVQYMAKNMTTGETTSRSVEGGTLTRGVVMQDGKPYTAYFFEGDTNFATTPLVAASVEAIKPATVINMGQTQGPSRVEIGATNRANTSVPGFDSEGNKSTNFARNESPVVDENNTARGSTIMAPDTIKNFAATANLPLSSSATMTGDYLCNATSYASFLAASGYKAAPGGFQPLPGLTMGQDANKVADGGAAATTTAASTVGFVHVNENAVPADTAQNIFKAAAANADAAQPGVVAETPVATQEPVVQPEQPAVVEPTQPVASEPTVVDEPVAEIGLH